MSFFSKKKTLTGLARTCGWAARIGLTVLPVTLQDLQPSEDQHLLIGFETSDVLRYTI